MEEGRKFDLDKYRSIGHVGDKQPKTTIVSKYGGTQTEHWDGRVDAHVVVPSIEVTPNVNEVQ